MIFETAAVKERLSLFLTDWLLSVCTILPFEASTHIWSPVYVGHWLEQEHNRIINCPLLSLYSVDAFYGVVLLEWKKQKKPEGAASFSRNEEFLPLPLNKLLLSPETAAISEGCAPLIRAWHGLLSYSTQRIDLCAWFIVSVENESHFSRYSVLFNSHTKEI